MRIGIDARLSHLPGVGRYIEQVVTHLAEIDRDNQYIIFYHARPAEQRYRLYYRNVNVTALARASNFEFVDVAAPAPSIREQWLLPLLLRRHRIDVLHAPFVVFPLIKVCPTVVTIHDLIMKWVPDTFPSIASRSYIRGMTKWALRFSDQIVVVSHFIEQEILAIGPQYRSKVHCVPNGVGSQFRPVLEESEILRIRKRYGISKDYVLFVGTRKPNKNLDRLIEAFGRVSALLSDCIQLVIVAKTDHQYPSATELVRRLALEGKVLFIDHVDEVDLPAVYSAARMLVLPSLHEGFGFPLVEAMACGTPVIGSDVTSMPEIVGDAGILVNARSVDEIVNAMRRLLTDQGLAEDMKDKGLKRAAQFSWESSARRHREIYERTKSIF